jgi:large repetitive protein
MKKISILFIVIFSLTTKFFSQTKLDYDNNTKWFWGVNGGVTWHSTDVRTKNNWGYGFILGKSFNYDYGKAISFDFRSRFLHGEWYGQNNTKTDTIVINKTLSSGNTNYKDSFNYYLLNFKSIFYSVDLELVIHANSLRERTGWDLYAFGGVGLSAFKAKGDLLNKSGKMYNYDELDNLKDGSLSNFLDKKYESHLDGTSKAINFYLMPSVGLGLGYQLTRNISLGLEHKMIFTRVDHFDGYNDPKGSNKTFINRENDIAHYSNAYLRFHIHHNRHRDTDTKNDVITNNDNQRIPEINFTNPVASGTNVSSSLFTVKANIDFIQSRENVNFKHNGVYTEGFSYNNTSKKFESNVVLFPGQNIFEIVASNSYGFDQKSTIIVYREPQQALPVVNFLNPATNPLNIASNNIQIRANVLNVNNQSQINVNVNGIQINNFVFSSSNGSLSFSSNLTVGSNIVTITATNQAGSDSKTTTIIYNPVITEQQPIVYFTDPVHSPYTTLNQTFNLKAEIVNIIGNQNITFKQNGSINQNFVYNAFNHQFESSVYLVPGQNVFEIIASNSSGTAQATTIITYQRAAPLPPVVTITNPVFSPFTTVNNIFPLNATVLNVSNSNQILVELNGQSLNFEFNSFTKTLTSSANLSEGQNLFVVRATNNDGSDSKQSIIVYNRPVTIQAPVVTFTNPNVNPFITDNITPKLSALVLNVENNSGINVNVNGNNITNFNFNTATKTVSFSNSLIEGANIITITGSNSAGTDSKTITILYNKAQQVFPPTVNFIDPHDNPHTVYNQNYVVKALVSNIKVKNDVQVKINGKNTTNFSYNSSTEIITIDASLLVGANIFEVSATNTSGSDSKTTTIIHQVSEPLNPPVVKIEFPIKKNHETSTASINIDATVLNISNRNNIEVFINDVISSNFNYDETTKKVTLLMPLKEGQNKLLIKATNASGTSQDSRIITYKKEIKIDPPLVSFINPNSNNQTVNAINYTIKASVLNVENANQITLNHNGQVINPQNYTFNNNTKELRYLSSLASGNNVFTVSASNVSGSHSASTSIIFKAEEKPCEKPVISFVTPISSGLEVTQSNYVAKLKVTNVTSQNQIEILVNGVLTQGIYNLTSNIMILNINLKEGQNIVEVKARNRCGQSNANTIINYKKPNVPCTNIPSLQLIQPLRAETTTENTSQEVRVGILNIVNTNDIIFKVNGQNTPFNYDVSSKILNSTVQLKDGLNTIEIQTSNECGSAGLTIKITKKQCNKPTLNINSTSVQNNSSTNNENFVAEGIVTGIQNSNEISITNNGQAINFIYNSVGNSFSFNTNLFVGVNNFVIKAKNSCGEDQKTLAITRNKVVKVNPPTIKITNPATTPFSSSNPAINVQAVTQNITSKSQVSLSINGQPVNVNFNPSNGSLTYNLTLVEGNNVITASAVNESGTASDTKNIVYSKPVQVQRPQVFILNPSTCPASLNKGFNQISGYILNVTAVNQVQIKVDGVQVSAFNPVILEDKMNYQFNVNLTNPNVFSNIEIIASNSAGSDQKSCQVRFTESTSNCLPTVNATFGADDKSVTVVSTKDLSNVVIKYHDGTVQKYDNLSGLTRTFSVSGLFSNKCIVGVWIKSGCNQSSDGPGYGEYVKNPKAKTMCETIGGGGKGDPNCKPTVRAEFSTDSKSVTAFSTKALSNVVLKYFDGTVQKFENLTGLSKNFTGNGANAGKCIIGVWIKSGCNQSNDGPGYGEYVTNNNVASTCSNSNPTDDCKPTINVVFAPNSKRAIITSNKEIKIIIMKFHDGQEQRVNVNSVLNRTVSGTGVNEGKCIVGVWVKSGCNQNSLGAQYGDWFANPQNTTNCSAGSGNNGHGNNEDGIDSSNPGKGSGGPNGGTDGSGDDEKGKGGNKNTPTNPSPRPGGNKPPSPGGKRGG